MLLLKSEYSLSLPAKTISTQQRSTKSAHIADIQRREERYEGNCGKNQSFRVEKKTSKKNSPPRAVLKYRNNKSILRRNKNLSFLSLLLLLEESKELHISLLLVFDDDDNYDDAQEQRETGITHQIKEERERERERIDFTISLCVWFCWD